VKTWKAYTAAGRAQAQPGALAGVGARLQVGKKCDKKVTKKSNVSTPETVTNL